MRNPISFNHLECFLTAARTQSFSETSRVLKIAQPAVSKQIRLLEEQLDCQLFIRNKRGAVLTDAGRDLYLRVGPLYDSLCEEVGSVKKEDGQLQGRLRFGCLSEVGEKIFLDPLSQFKKNHPELMLQIQYLRAFEIIERIKGGELDLGVVSEKIIQENIKTYEIFNEEILLVTNKENARKKLSRLTDLPYVTYREDDPLLKSFIQKLAPRSNQTQMDIQICVNSHRSMVKMLQDHPFYAVLPRLSISEELSKGLLVHVENKTVHSKLYLIMRDVHISDKKIELFRAHFIQYIKTKFK